MAARRFESPSNPKISSANNSGAKWSCCSDRAAPLRAKAHALWN